MLNEQAIAKVVLVDFVGKIFCAVKVSFGGCRLQNSFAVDNFGIGIVKRIHVHCQAETVFGNSRRVRNESEVETRRIVIAHGKFVVGVVFVDQANLFSIG